jgi:hypothetical protein
MRSNSSTSVSATSTNTSAIRAVGTVVIGTLLLWLRAGSLVVPVE